MTEETTSLEAQINKLEQRVADLERSGEKDALVSELENYAALLKRNNLRLLDAANMTAKAKALRSAAIYSDSKECLSCAERIKTKAVKCRFCGASQTKGEPWTGFDKERFVVLVRRYGIHACLIVAAMAGCKLLIDKSMDISTQADQTDKEDKALTERIIDRRKNPNKDRKPLKFFDLTGKNVSDVSGNLFHFINDHEVDLTSRSGRTYSGTYSLDGVKLRVVVDAKVLYYKYLGSDILQDDIEHEYGLDSH